MIVIVVKLWELKAVGKNLLVNLINAPANVVHRPR